MDGREWADLHGEPYMSRSQFDAEQAAAMREAQEPDHPHDWELRARDMELYEGTLIEVIAVCTVEDCGAVMEQEEITYILNGMERRLPGCTVGGE